MCWSECGAGELCFCLCLCFFLMMRRPPGPTQSRSSAASDVYKRQKHSPEHPPLGAFNRFTKFERVSRADGCGGRFKAFRQPAGRRILEKLGRSGDQNQEDNTCLLYTSPSPRDSWAPRMPSFAWKKTNKYKQDQKTINIIHHTKKTMHALLLAYIYNQQN